MFGVEICGRVVAGPMRGSFDLEELWRGDVTGTEKGKDKKGRKMR